MPSTYVCFDADNDIHYYRLMQAWDANPRLDFTFVNAHDLATLLYAQNEQYIKSRLRQRFEGTTEFLLLVGESTKYLYKFVRWEIELAIEKNLPIIVVNLNGMKAIDVNRCPPILREKLAIHISFNQRIIDHAIHDWPQQHYQNYYSLVTGPFYYPQDVYTRMGIYS